MITEENRAAVPMGQYSYQEIGDFFGLHFTTVGKIVRKRLMTEDRAPPGASGHRLFQWMSRATLSVGSAVNGG